MLKNLIISYPCYEKDKINKHPDGKVAHIPEEREGKFTTYLS